VHTGFGLGRLAPGAALPSHLHSYEESLYVLEGEVVVQTPGEAALLGPGDYGWIPVGVEHSLRNEGAGEVRWARMSAPTPRADHDADTYLVPELPATEAPRPDVRDPRTRRYGHIDPANMEPSQQTQDRLAVSASMRTALLVYSGITVKMMVDSDLGAVLSTMFMVQYEPDGVAGAHDHPLEETYLILEGSVEATFDGKPYVLGVGDVAWAGVGCVHGFRNVGDGPVRWLETQAPQPPGRHSYRFARDWEYLRSRLETGSTA
jgi:quercetin dioxygenase-like cupin family protein